MESGGNLRALGAQLAEFIKHRSAEQSTSAPLQAVIADLAVVHPDLIAPLKDLVSRRSFRSLIPHASSGGGVIQRDALIQEISRTYHPAVLVAIEDVLNGFLASSGGVASQLSQSNFIQDQSSNAQVDDNKSGASSKSQIFSSSLKGVDIKSQNLSAGKSYFVAALEIAKQLHNTSLESVSANTSSGHHEKLPVAISARQSRVDKEMSPMDRPRRVPNFSWCPSKGLFNYVLRDSSWNDLARVPLAMVDAKFHSGQSTRSNQHGSTNQLMPASSPDPFFLKAVDLARRMGNTNLAEASAPASGKGIFNYTIRDAMSNTLAKVPLSML